jgi:hypothetical protein
VIGSKDYGSNPKRKEKTSGVTNTRPLSLKGGFSSSGSLSLSRAWGVRASWLKGTHYFQNFSSAPFPFLARLNVVDALLGRRAFAPHARAAPDSL